MKMIVAEKAKAEEREVLVKELTIKVNKKKVEIKKRKKVVQEDLDKAGPALEKAKKNVEKITKRQVNDIRALNNPPKLIKMTCQAICLVLTRKVQEWKQIQKIMK